MWVKNNLEWNTGNYYFWTSKQLISILFFYWWCYPTPSEGWGRGGTPRRPNSRATPQGLDQSSKIKNGRWSSKITNVSPPQRGGVLPAPLSERWAEMVRQLPWGARPSGPPQSSGIIFSFYSLLYLYIDQPSNPIGVKK